MSHIKEKKELLKLKYYLESLAGEKASYDIVSRLFNNVVPKNVHGKNLVGVVVAGAGNDKTTGFMPFHNTIYVPFKPFLVETQESAENLGEVFDYDDYDKLSAYYRLFAALHEAEHGYQFLIANEKIPFKYNEVKDGYKYLVMHCFNKHNYVKHCSRKDNPIIKKYFENPYDYVFERNAMVEACDDTSFIAGEMKDDEIRDIFDSYKDSIMVNGYEASRMGSMIYTYESLLPKNMYDKVEKDSNMPMEERARFGLEVDEETRAKVLVKARKSKLNL